MNVMAKKQSNSSTQQRSDAETARLGCTFDVQTLELINAAALMRSCSTAEVLAEAIWSLVGTMEPRQREAVLGVVRAKHGRLKRSCGHTVSESPAEEPEQGRAGGLLSDDRLQVFSRIHQRATSPVDAALESL